MDHDYDHGIRLLSSVNTDGSRLREQTGDPAAEPVNTSTDPAAVVSMILSGAARRKGEGTGLKKQPDRQNYGSSLHPYKAPHRSGGGDTMSASSGTPLSRPFLMSGRPLSSGSVPKTPNLPSSPPPAPARPDFPSPVLRVIKFPDLRSLSPLRERAAYDYGDFTEATIQRTERAKRALQLSYDYKKLLEVYQYKNNGKETVYNPLQAIRDRRLRAKKKIQLDVSQWENVDAVQRWIENVADTIVTPGGVETPVALPAPPQGDGTGRVLKRPKIEWHVAPEELFADFYWNVKNEERARELQRKKNERSRGLDIQENEKATMWPSNDTYESSYEFTSQLDPSLYRSSHLPTDAYHYESTASTDTESSDSTNSSASSGPNTKHHRRRRKLGKIITGSRHRSRKKPKDSTSKEEIEELEWVPFDNDEPTVPASPFIHHGMEAEDAYNSISSEEAADAEDPEDEQSVASGNIGKNTLDSGIVPGSGLGISGGTADYVVPSIAISLSPPRSKIKEDIEDRPDEKRPSNPKKLLSKGIDAFNFFDKEPDDSRDSLEILRPKKSSDLKERSQKKLGKVKSRVDKLRSEVAKVEDYIPWKRDASSAAPSPTASSFTCSDDDMEWPFMRRDGTASASEMDDDRYPRTGRQSLEVPRPAHLRRASKHRSHFSTSQIPPLRKRLSMTSDRDTSPSRPDPKLNYLPREPSPIRNVHIESLHERERKPLILNIPSKARLPPAINVDKAPEPAKNERSPQGFVYRRDPDGTKLAWLRAGIVARGISEKLPSNPSLHPTCASVQADLDALAVSHRRFNRTSAPRLLNTATGVNDEISTIIPQLQEIADECHRLESLTTTEISKAIGATREDLRRLRRRGRWKIRRLARLASSTLGWWVTIILWCVWAGYMMVNLVLLVLVGPIVVATRVGFRAVKATGKWLLWLE